MSCSAHTRPARVVLLLQDLKFGGSQSQVLELAGGLNPARFQCELWTMMDGDDLLPRARQRGVKVRSLGRAGYVWPPALARLVWMLHKRRPDILVMYTGIPNIWGRLLGRTARTPLLLATCRGARAFALQHEKALWRLAHHHLCNAEGLGELLRQRLAVPSRRISVIPNGVDTVHFRPGPATAAGSQVILSLGRLSPEKGHRRLLAAFARITGRHPEARLKLVGDGPQRDSLMRLAQTGSLRGRVEVLPGDPSPLELYQNAGLLALPSEHEGMPNVVMEAMACGLPVAACRVGGVPELVKHRKTGLMVRPGDEGALASALDVLLSNPGQASAWGRAGRLRMERHFTVAAMVTAHQELFSRLLSRQRMDLAR